MKRSHSFWLIACIALLASPPNAHAQVYKCKDATGALIFSDKKCSDSAEVLEIKEYNKIERSYPRTFYCPSGITAVINNLHYPALDDPAEAVRLADADYTSLRYRKMIKRVDPSDELPDRVSRIQAEAFPASEVPGFSNGVVVNVKVCK